jgi:hypothetical protein
VFAGIKWCNADIGLTEELGHALVGLHAKEFDVGCIAGDGTHGGKLGATADELEAGRNATIVEQACSSDGVFDAMPSPK